MTDALDTNITDIISDLEERFRAHLTDGHWTRTRELQEVITDDHAQLYCELASPLSLTDSSDPLNCGRRSLAQEVIQSLSRKGRIDTRQRGGQEEVRLCPEDTDMAPWSTQASVEEETPLEDADRPQEDLPSADASTAQPLAPCSDSATDLAPPSTSSPEPDPEPGTCTPPASLHLYELPVILLPIEDLKPHPIAASIPRMPTQQWDPFLDDIRVRDVQEPIIVTREHLIADGIHRHEAALARGNTHIPCRVIDWDEDEVAAFIYRMALGRRHLTDDQRAILAAELQERESRQARTARAQKAGKAGGRGRPRGPDSLETTSASKLSAGAGKGKASCGRTRKQAAAQHQVSERKVRDATTVKRASPETANKVLQGDLTLQEAKRKLSDGKPKSPPKIDRQPRSSPSPGAEKAADPLQPTTDGVDEAGSPDSLTLTRSAGPLEMAQALIDQLGPEKAVAVAQAVLQLDAAPKPEPEPQTSREPQPPETRSRLRKSSWAKLDEMLY